MITPAVLISASGTLVLSTSNRLSRVMDRARVLTRDCEALTRTMDGERAEAKRSLMAVQLTSVAERAVLLRSALAALYTAIGFFVATSVGVGFVTLLRATVIWPPVLLAMVGAFALLYGSVLLVREGRLAIGSTLSEMNYARRVIGDLPAAPGQGRPEA
jgi:hypothetical protein